MLINYSRGPQHTQIPEIYYKLLQGSCVEQLPMINPFIMKNGEVLNRDQQMLLVKLVSKVEVVDASKGINDLKA